MARALILILLLAGCARTPGVRVEYQRVEVPLPVPCMKRSDIGEPPAPLGPRDPDWSADRLLDIALAKLVELLGEGLDGRGGYVGKVEAVRPACEVVPAQTR